jgi:hypothetical protein
VLSLQQNDVRRTYTFLNEYPIATLGVFI